MENNSVNEIFEIWLFSYGATTLVGQASTLSRLHVHSQTYNTVGLLWTVISQTQRPLPANTQARQHSNPQSQQASDRRSTSYKPRGN